MSSDSVEIWKAVIAGLATLGAAGIVGRYGRLTAENITKAIEDKKINSAEKLDRDRRKAELYKMLFAERIALGKKLGDLAGMIYQRSITYYAGQEWSTIRLEVTRLNLELFNLANSTEWLTNKVLMQSVQNLQNAVNNLVSDRRDVGTKDIDDVREKVTALSYAISKMMNDDNLDRLIKID